MALATPPGVGAVAVVRLSGPRAVEVADRLCEGGLPEGERNTRLRPLLRPGSGETLDRALVTWFRGPASYTGEDVVELSVHGGPLAPALVVEACRTLGARAARPGEFTQRAYLNGKLDLTQAEAVADLVAAASPRGREVAVHQLERGLGERIARLREGVVGLAAHLVQHIDFPEEDDAPTPVGVIAASAREVAAEVDRLLATAPAGELLREGAMVVLGGRPNSGKSSLFNALVGTERAIVTDRAGTTRDAIEAQASLDGFPFRLVDTAGLRASASGIERLGVEVAHRCLAGADIVLYCRDGAEADPAGEAFLASLSCPVLRVRTKVDLEAGAEAEAGEIRTSARTGKGLPELRRALRELAFRGVVEARHEVPVVTRRRQARLLAEARAEIVGFAEALDGGVPAEFASAHLKAAETALEEILGVVAADDVLDRVFRDFCIGK